MQNSYKKCNDFDTPHGFSQRNSGYSKGCFSSLNLGFTYGDNPDNVQKNWNKFSVDCGVDVEHLCFANQVHENNVAVVGIHESINPARDVDPKPVGDYDGLVTNTPNLSLAIFTADCGCVLLSDRQAHVVAALHCGWKPLCAGIIGVGLSKMKSLGADTKNIKVAIGPCIGKCCFEVGSEVILSVANLLGSKNTISKNDFLSQQTSNPMLDNLYSKTNNPDKYMLDLRGAIRADLVLNGIDNSSIFDINLCTCCNTDKYFSYRAENGKTGRLAGIICNS